MRAVGKHIYSRPAEETFHEFILQLLIWTLGKEWYCNERTKSLDERHQIIKWFDSYTEFSKSKSVDENKKGKHWVTRTSGDVQSLAALAYDIYHLLHTNTLSYQMIDRLKNWEEFQGARHELAVAAIFVRCGFNLIYPASNSKTGPQIPEFFAEHHRTKKTIAIEAKSRQRDGVLHKNGDFDPSTAVQVDVRRLLNKAIRKYQSIDMAYTIFIDLNAMPTNAKSGFDEPWAKDIKNLPVLKKEPSCDDPDPFNAIFFTNFSYYYARDGDSPSGKDLSFISPFTKYPFPMEILSSIHDAVITYGVIPDEPY